LADFKRIQYPNLRRNKSHVNSFLPRPAKIQEFTAESAENIGFSKIIAEKKRIWWRRASWWDRHFAGHPWATRQSPLQPVPPL
jgi:hypothetical protein